MESYDGFIESPGWHFAVFALALTIGTTGAIAQDKSPPPKSISLDQCHIKLIGEVEVASGIPGVLDYVTPEEGDPVAKGEPIVGLKADVPLAQKAVALKEAQNDVEVRYAQKAAELADAEYVKAVEANRRLEGTVASVELDRLRLAAERAHLQIESAELDLEVASLKANEAEANLMAYNLKAPISGVVTKRDKSAGEAVRQGDVILKIQITDRVRVEGWVDLVDSFRIKPGDPVKVHLDIPGVKLKIEDEEFDGVLKFVDLTVEPVFRKVKVWAEVQNPKNILKAGLTAKMTITPRKTEIVQTTMAAP